MVEKIYQRTVSNIAPAARLKRVSKDRDKKHREDVPYFKKNTEDASDSDTPAENSGSDDLKPPADPLKGKFINVVL